LALLEVVAEYMRSAYILRMRQIQLRLMPMPAGTDVPSVGEIKCALHELSGAAAGAAPRDHAAILRQVNELVRRCALSNGVDPDAVVQRRRDIVHAQRERMLGGTASTPDPAP